MLMLDASCERAVVVVVTNVSVRVRVRTFQALPNSTCHAQHTPSLNSQYGRPRNVSKLDKSRVKKDKLLEWKYHGYTGSRAGPARRPIVGTMGLRGECLLAAGKGIGRPGRPSLTRKQGTTISNTTQSTKVTATYLVL
jgi:hypothetical protein